MFYLFTVTVAEGYSVEQCGDARGAGQPPDPAGARRPGHAAASQVDDPSEVLAIARRD